MMLRGVRAPTVKRQVVGTPDDFERIEQKMAEIVGAMVPELHRDTILLNRFPLFAPVAFVFEETLRQVGLWEQRHLQIGSPQEKVLSGGQRRRGLPEDSGFDRGVGMPARSGGDRRYR